MRTWDQLTSTHTKKKKRLIWPWRPVTPNTMGQKQVDCRGGGLPLASTVGMVNFRLSTGLGFKNNNDKEKQLRKLSSCKCMTSTWPSWTSTLAHMYIYYKHLCAKMLHILHTTQNAYKWTHFKKRNSTENMLTDNISSILLSWRLSGGLIRLSKVRGPYSDCGAENPGIKHENIQSCSLLQLSWRACNHSKKRRTPSRLI